MRSPSARRCVRAGMAARTGSATLAGLALIGALTLALVPSPAAAAWADDFEDATLRIDLVHAGRAGSEQYALEELRREGPWPGRRQDLVAASPPGCHVAELAASDGRVLWREGYCTIFGEWQTTEEAAATWRSFSETLRTPMPRRPVELRVSVRQRGTLTPVWRLPIDPSSRGVRRDVRRHGFPVLLLHDGGPPERALDLLILPDGYAREDLPKLRRDVRRFADLLLATPPFREASAHVSVRAIEVVSPESGIDEPRKGVWRDTALGLSFNTFDVERYVLTTDNRSVRDIAAAAPYDALILLANSSRYGGGGIYNLYATAVSDNEFDDYVVLHELGHSLAGLGDEYFTSTVAYNDMYPRGVEPWEPNLTALLRPPEVKWKALVTTGTPIPTPPDRARFGGAVGAFEGGGYAAKGIFRPTLDCRMFSKAHRDWCPVCRRAIEQTLAEHTR